MYSKNIISRNSNKLAGINTIPVARGKIFENQNDASKEILEWYEESRRWVVLLAEMQSGKSTTYLLTGIEMLCRNIVNKVIIFSGNTETSIRNQIRDDIKLVINNYIERVGQIDPFVSLDERVEFTKHMEEISKNIIVVWGSELTRHDEQYTKTLFIWDESHAAQTKNMRPDKFLINQGIIANGDLENLEKTDNYVLSVSATPFSECSNILHHHSHLKSIVRLRNGSGYIGLNSMKESGNIIPYSNWKEGLKSALLNFNPLPKQSLSGGRSLGNCNCTDSLSKEKVTTSTVPSYGIIRSTSLNYEEIKRFFEHNNDFDYIVYDSTKKSNITSIEQFDSTMRKVPSKNTIIIINGMLRMGKELPKENIKFCMETANNPKTDTILQGLLGRMCGYHPYNKIKIYIKEKIFNSGELERYIDMMSNYEVISTMPHKGNNLSNGTYNKSDLNPIIPIKLNTVAHAILPDGATPTKKTSNRKEYNRSYKAYIKDVFHSGNFISTNTEEQNTEIANRVRDIDIDSAKMKLIYINNKNKSSNHYNATKKIYESLTTQKPMKLGSSNGISANGSDKINIRIYECDFPEFDIKRGDIYIDARTESGDISGVSREHKDIPKTTKKEVFYQKCEEVVVLDDEYIPIVNDSYRLPLQSMNTIEGMKNGIIDLLQTRSSTSLSIVQIDSNQPIGSKIKGLLVTNEVFDAILPDGAIYKYVKENYDIRLHINKKKGRQSAKYNGYVQFNELCF
jgi:hypothetical protein